MPGRVTIAEVAKEAGVSIRTDARVFNNRRAAREVIGCIVSL
ncbi:MAG: LacI family DNA-binding transcriptional regulator [Chloroflexi bacterium]|nr:LacI family DNA-binding transcriptional regulator [Chloroflexota bacterium]